MTAVRFEVFEDLLLGNFMKTTLHGAGAPAALADVFLYVGKYADNGRAKTTREVQTYLAEYRRRLGKMAQLRHTVEQAVIRHARRHGAEPAAWYRVGRALYLRMRRAGL